MPKKVIRRRINLGSVARLGIVVAIIVIYAAYWVATPSNIEVTSIEPSQAQFNVMQVTLHNPTYKIVTGAVVRVEASVDVPTGHGGTTVLQSIPSDYPFTLLPQTSAQLAIPMNFRVLPGFDYDIIMRIDGLGEKTITMNIPKT